MLPKLKALLALVVLSAPFGCAAQPAIAQSWSLVEMNRTIDQTNFLVNDGCSGTLIDTANLYVLTANHCVTDQYKVIEKEEIDEDGEVTKKKVRIMQDGSVTQYDFKDADIIRTVNYKTRLIAYDRDSDLALLQLKSANIAVTKAAKLSCDLPVRGEKVWIVGNPTGVLYSSVTSGIVSSIERNYDIVPFPNGDGKKPLMQISGGVVGGNSGGSVYNERGELIGVPVLGHRINEVIAFAVPPQSIKTFLTSNKLGGLYDRCNPKKGDEN